MPSHSANSSSSDESTSSYETTTTSSSSGDDDDAFRPGRRKRKPKKLSLRRLKASVSASVERAPPHHRDRAAMEVAELFLQVYAEAKNKEVKAEIERLAFWFYASPFSLAGLSLAARRKLERAAAGALPEARRKGFLRAVRDASIAEKRGGGKSPAARGAEGEEEEGAAAAEKAAAASTSTAADDADAGERSKSNVAFMFLSPAGLFELVPDVVRHLAGFLAPVDALSAAGVCEC